MTIIGSISKSDFPTINVNCLISSHMLLFISQQNVKLCYKKKMHAHTYKLFMMAACFRSYMYLLLNYHLQHTFTISHSSNQMMERLLRICLKAQQQNYQAVLFIIGTLKIKNLNRTSVNEMSLGKGFYLQLLHSKLCK